MAKATVVLGMLISLVGGIAPQLIKADGSIDVTVKGEASVVVGFRDKPKWKPAAPKKIAKSPKAAVKKGDKTMTTIDSIKNGVGKALSLPGE